MLEVAVVGIVVAVAIAYTVWALMPAGRRAANRGSGPCRDCAAHAPPSKDPPQ